MNNTVNQEKIDLKNSNPISGMKIYFDSYSFVKVDMPKLKYELWDEAEAFAKQLIDDYLKMFNREREGDFIHVNYSGSDWQIVANVKIPEA